MIKPSIISVADQELLEEFRLAFVDSKQGIGTEFQQAMQAHGFDEQHPLTGFFSDMLLSDGEALMKLCFGTADGSDSRSIIAIFDSYLACLARQAPLVIKDAVKIRRTMEALRRLAFYYMSMALGLRETAENSRPDAELFDHNTGMLNQEGFTVSLDFLLKDESNWNVAVVLLEFGYSMSMPDAIASLQQEIAQRLMQVARDGDLVARISPKRWILGLRQIKSVAFANLAALKLQRLFEKPMVVAGYPIFLKLRIGVAMAPEYGKQADQLLRVAIEAARWAATTEDGVQFYSEAVGLRGTREYGLGERLRKALFENALELHYQPQFSMSRNRVVGLEALVRWTLPEGQVPPLLIIGTIEQENIVPQFTQWLIHTSFRNFADFRRQGIETTLSINLMNQMFALEELPEILTQAANVWKIPLDQVVLEVNEGSLLSDIDTTMWQIERLRETGISISMDDFGTGYASMTYLSRLEIDELKIDHSFIRAIPLSYRDKNVVRAIINLAVNFNLNIVAVGVETEDIARIIEELGCDIIQGSWVSQPLPPEKLVAWFKQNPL
ncbi:MAG TPA: GGDEF domain-containing phosphodiesterase [Methylophilaceae bacterium]|nr:GGDEF domain-containing phosphodiesterase [Methylophilaceae bacterium]